MNNAKQDKARCIKIEAIRIEACKQLGTNREEKCPACTRAKDSPFFRADAYGHAIMGCVDAYHHDAYLMGEGARWYRRPAAQAIRASDLQFLTSL